KNYYCSNRLLIKLSGYRLEERTKKRLIVLLLFISCLVSGYFLWEVSDESARQLKSAAQADSLIEQQLQSFSIDRQQIELTTVEAGSSFQRKIYEVALPKAFSKTQLHATLNRSFRPLVVSTPAQVTFPERDINIHLYYKGVIFRTIRLETDADLQLRKNRASIMVLFNEPPDEELLNMLTSFGEPISIVLTSKHPMQANELLKAYRGQYNRLLFWIQNEDHEDLFRLGSATVKRRLNQFENLLPNAHFLLISPKNGSSASSQKVIAQTSLTFIDARQALQLHQGLGKAS